MKHFAKIVYGFKPLTNLVKTFVLDLRLGSENASEIPSALISPYENFLKSDEPSFSSNFFYFQYPLAYSLDLRCAVIKVMIDDATYLVA